ncbi:MAG: YybH family protein [Gemmatimonadota bacterium]
MRGSHLLLAAALLVTPSALWAQEHEQEEKDHMDATAAITEAAEALETAWNARDWEAVTAMYVEDAVVMPMNVEALTGSEAIYAFFSATPEGWSLDLETTEVFSVEGAALEVGNWVMSTTEGEHADHGNYMAVWTWTDDGWKMGRDMWNSNMSPPAAGGD